jgi:hypothetical protein
LDESSAAIPSPCFAASVRKDPIIIICKRGHGMCEVVGVNTP